jgi:hypothetical protein
MDFDPNTLGGPAPDAAQPAAAQPVVSSQPTVTTTGTGRPEDARAPRKPMIDVYGWLLLLALILLIIACILLGMELLRYGMQIRPTGY